MNDSEKELLSRFSGDKFTLLMKLRPIVDDAIDFLSAPEVTLIELVWDNEWIVKLWDSGINRLKIGCKLLTIIKHAIRNY